MVDHTGIVADSDPDRLNLDVYDTKNGLWCPEHGDLELPQGWEFLAAGDNFVTRRMKASGVYWTLWQPRGRHRAHRRKIGVLAPRRRSRLHEPKRSPLPSGAPLNVP